MSRKSTRNLVKRFSLFCVLLVVLMINPVNAASEERVTNGNFETGDFTGWVNSDGDSYGASIVDEYHAYNGEYGAQIIDIYETSGVQYFHQDVDLTNVDKIYYRYYIDEANGGGEFNIIIDGVTEKTYTSRTGEKWYIDSVDVSGYSGVNNVKFEAYYGGDEIDVYIDDITTITPTFVDFDGGSGTSADPYQISNVDQLQAIQTNLSAHYEITCDINASKTSTWNDNSGFEPIGETNSEFTGSINGNGYKISNLTVHKGNTVDNVGFISINSGLIENLGFENISIRGDESVGLIGVNWGGTVSECYVHGEVFTDNRFGYDRRIGGLIGVVDDGYISTVKNCYANVSVSGKEYVGGLVGIFKGKIYGTEGICENSYSIGDVSGNDYVGGLTGMSWQVNYISSYWNINTSGQTTSDGGTGLTDTEMQTRSNFVNWDFTNTWQMGTYPVFTWQSVPQTIIVDINGSGNYTSIQEAINNASVSDTISIEPGTYTENIDITKSLTIESSTLNRSDVIIQPESSGYVINITSDNVNIESVSIDGTDLTNIGGINVNTADGVSINNTVVKNNTENGISIYGSNNPVISNSMISFNTGNGVYLNTVDSAEIYTNVISSNGKGIYLENANNGITYDNLFCNIDNLDFNGVNTNNEWNSTLTLDTNIVNGDRKGGNVWTNTDGTVYPLDGTDDDTNGVFDQTYNTGNGIDNYPIMPVRISSSSTSVISPATVIFGSYIPFEYDSYTWDFGDGTVTGLCNIEPSHDYENVGTFVVQLIVSNSETGITISSNEIVIEITPGRQIIEVRKDGTGDYTTIQEAINNSNPYDTVKIFPGTYEELITIDVAHLNVVSSSSDASDVVIIHTP